MLTIIVGQIINLKQLFVIQKNKGTSIFSYLIFIKRIKEREDHTNVKNKKIRGGGYCLLAIKNSILSFKETNLMKEEVQLNNCVFLKGDF